MKILIRTNIVSLAFILMSCFKVNADALKNTTSLLDKLGVTSNVNKPEIWQDQLGGFATGGSIHARVPTTDLKLLHVDLPSISAGCGGIDLFGGGFGYINNINFEQLIKQIGTGAISYGVMLTIKSLSPQVADLLENLESVARFMNAQNINSCQISASIASGLFPKTQAAQNLACQARSMGSKDSVGNIISDVFTARYSCQDPQFSRQKNDEKKEDGLLGANYNLVWKALDKVGAGEAALTEGDKEFLMTLSGTLIVTMDDKGKSKFEHKNSLIKDPKLIKAIVYGETPQDMEFYDCRDGEKGQEGQCLNMGKKTYNFKPENAVLYKVRKLLNSIADKIAMENKGASSAIGQVQSSGLDADEMHLATTTSYQ